MTSRVRPAVRSEKTVRSNALPRTFRLHHIIAFGLGAWLAMPPLAIGGMPTSAATERPAAATTAITLGAPLQLADAGRTVRDPHQQPGRVMPRPPISTQRPSIFEPPVTVESLRRGRFSQPETPHDGGGSRFPGTGRDGRSHRTDPRRDPGQRHRNVPGRVWIINPSSGISRSRAPQDELQPAPVAPRVEPQVVEPPPQRDVVHDGRASIDIRSMRAEPQRLLVRPGTEVVWTSHDFMPHTIQSPDDGPLDSGVLQWNDDYRHVFEERGVYEYRCRFHPELRGIVEVVGGRR